MTLPVSTDKIVLMRGYIFAAILILAFSVPVYPFQLHISDLPNDDGTKLVVNWDNLPPTELENVNPETYSLERSDSTGVNFTSVAMVSRDDTTRRTTDGGLKTGHQYYYRLSYVDSTTGAI